MGKEFNIAAGIVLDGEKEFKQAVSNTNKSLGVMRSEMNLLKATYEGNANSLEALRAKQEAYQKQADLQKQKIEEITKGLTHAKESYEKLENSLKNVKKEYEQASSKMDEMKKSTEYSTEELEEQEKKLGLLSDALKLGTGNLEKSQNRIKEWEKQLNNANTQMITLTGEMNKNNEYLKEAESSTDKCATSIDKFGNEVHETSTKVSNLGEIIKVNLISEAVISGIEKLGEATKKITVGAIDVGRSFESSMSQVAATMGMTMEEISSGSVAYETLQQAAKECGANTMYSASQAAEALNYLALAGYDYEKAAEALPKVLNLAAAGDMELAAASDLATDAAAALGLETSELDKHIDQMAKTSQKSNTSVSQLGEAQLVCAGTVTSTGQSIETMNAELGVLANNGIKGAEGGTKLRNMLLSLASPTDVGTLALERLGVSVSDSSGNIRDLNDIMTDLNKSLSNLSEVDRTQTISAIFNKTDISAVNALLKGTGEEFDNLYKEISDCDGAAQDMADTMQDNLNGSITILDSAMEGLGIQIYEIFEDTLRESTNRATESIGNLSNEIANGRLGRSLEDMSDSVGDLAEDLFNFGEKALPVAIEGLTWIIDNRDTIASAAAGIVAALTFQKAYKTIKDVKDAMTGVKEATMLAEGAQKLLNLAQSASPMALIASAAVAAGTAIATYYILNMDKAKSKMEELKEEAEELIKIHDGIFESIETGRETREDDRASIEQEYGAIKILSDNLFDLTEKEEKSNTQKEKMKTLVDQINEAMPELNLQIDEETGLLNKQKKEVEDMIHSKQELYKVEAAKDDLVEIAREQYEAEKALVEAQEKRKEIEEELKSAQDGLSEAQEKLNQQIDKSNRNVPPVAQEVGYYSQEIQKAEEALEAIDKDIETANESIRKSGKEFEQTAEYVADYETKASEGIASVTEGVYKMSAETAAYLENLREAYVEAYEEAEKTVEGQIGLFNKFSAEVEMTNEEILENLQSQINGVRNWSENLKTLAEKGVNEGLLQTLRDMGPASAGYLTELITMSDEQIEELNSLWEEKLEVAREVETEMAEAKTGYRAALEEIQSEAARLPSEMSSIGANTMQSWASAVISETDTIVSAYSKAAIAALSAVKREYQIQSPSRAFKKMAGFTMEGWAEGASAGKDIVKNAYLDVAAIALDSSRIPLDKNLYHTGENLGRAGIKDTDFIKKQENGGLVEAINRLIRHEPETSSFFKEDTLYKAFKRALSDTTLRTNMDSGSVINTLIQKNNEFKIRTGKGILEG